MREVTAVIRRGIDIVVSAVALVVLSPLFLVVAVAIKIGSPGGAFYKGWRVGKNGRRFPMLKFRSMAAGADREAAVTSRDDNRITHVGRFLRASKLDELPQFWNVLVGDMTLVGPRPEAPQIVGRYTPEQARILSAKPGLTGPGAIACSLDSSMAVLDTKDADRYYVQHVLERRLTLDAEYLRSRSLLTDLIFIGKTCRLMLRALISKPA